jgi:transcriptional regulator with XRE-family HTH domain
MLPISKLKDARKAAKVSKKAAAEAIGKHMDAVTRIEEGAILGQLEDMARLYGFNILLLSAGETEILHAFEAVFGKKGAK